VVLDYPLSVNNSLELLAESAGHRSHRKLLLVILRNGYKEQGCGACRSGADPRIGPDLFVPTSISQGRRPMTVPRSPTTSRPVEAAADRVMLLWSLIKMVPDHELTLLRSSLVEKLSKQQHVTEDELVVVGLKYLHQNGQWKKRK